MPALGLVTNEQILQIVTDDLGWPDVGIRSRDSLGECSTRRIERVHLHGLPSSVPSIIVKSHPACDGRTLETWSRGRPGNAEASVHRVLPACSWLPRLYWSGELSGIGLHIEVVEDIADRAMVVGSDYTWSQKTIRAVVESLADLHACANRIGAQTWLSRCPWLVSCGVGAISSRWIEDIARGAGIVPVASSREDIQKALETLAVRYDQWARRLYQCSTLLHGDMCPGNVAMTDEDSGGRAVLLDFGEAVWGLPQYDLVYMSQRDWPGIIDWKQVHDVHYHSLRERVSTACDDRVVYDWGGRLALLQLILTGTGHVVDVYARWNEATERERSRASRAPIFASDVLSLCREVIEADPWQ